MASTSARCAFAIGLLFCSLVSPLSAATRTWSGTTDMNWTTAANWGGTAPVAGDDLVFPAGAANQSNSNNFAAGTAFHSLTFTGGNYLLGGNAITLGAGGINTTGGASDVALPVVLGAPQTWVLNTGSSTTDVLNDINLNGMALTINCDGDSANDLSGVISGIGSITVNNSSGLNLSGVSTTTAPFTFNDAGLFLSAGAYLGPITLNENASLAIDPGATVGPVTANGPFAEIGAGRGFPTNGTANSGSIVLTANAAYGVYLNAPTDFSALKVTGAVNLGGAKLMLFVGPTLIPSGTAFTIIDNDGSDAITGTFKGLPEGANVVSGFGAKPQIFTISYAGGTGNDVVLTAKGAATVTTTKLTSSINPSNEGQAVTFTATVTSVSGTAVPSGSVDFYDDFDKVATVPLSGTGVATFTTSALAPGTHSMEADYNGSAPFTSSFDDLDQIVPGSPRRRVVQHK